MKLLFLIFTDNDCCIYSIYSCGQTFTCTCKKHIYHGCLEFPMFFTTLKFIWWNDWSPYLFVTKNMIMKWQNKFHHPAATVCLSVSVLKCMQTTFWIKVSPYSIPINSDAMSIFFYPIPLIMSTTKLWIIPTNGGRASKRVCVCWWDVARWTDFVSWEVSVIACLISFRGGMSC